MNDYANENFLLELLVHFFLIGELFFYCLEFIMFSQHIKQDTLLLLYFYLKFLYYTPSHSTVLVQNFPKTIFLLHERASGIDHQA